MNQKTKERMDALLKTSASYTLAEFLRERKQHIADQLLTCDEKMVKHLQGRALELTELIKMCEKQGV